MRSVSNTHPNKSSGTFQTIQFASTRPPGVLITYGALDTISVNLAFLAHVELIKLCDALESNNMMIGHSFKKNEWCIAAAAAAVVLLLLLRGCTAAAAAAVGDCPRIVAEGGTAVPWVGCRSCSTSGQHC
jgi:hypothetical protein